MGCLNLSCPNLVLITLESVHPGLNPARSRPEVLIHINIYLIVQKCMIIYVNVCYFIIIRLHFV